MAGKNTTIGRDALGDNSKIATVARTTQPLTNTLLWYIIVITKDTTATIGAYYLGMIPYVGPFLAIGISILIEYLWSGELSIFGYGIDVEPLLINGKTIQEWVNVWVNSWFE